MAIPLPKLALFNRIATDGEQMYNASAFAALDNCTGRRRNGDLVVRR